MKNDNSYLERLNDDRNHLLYRLDRIGYIPDKDMREALSDIRADLKMRIDAVRKELEGRSL